MALAYRAGVPLKDMEFVQFHPTTLKDTGILITEGARGEGGYLLNTLGDRFLKRYAPEQMELATRSTVSLAIGQEILEGRCVDGCVLLDLDEKELAVGAFTGALRSHEAYADVHYHLARTLDSLGRPDEAKEHWQRFVNLSPESPWADEARDRLHG